MKFTTKTQTKQSMTYRTPSGNSYVSTIGTPFEVKDKEDIAYFEKYPKRFVKGDLKETLQTPLQELESLLAETGLTKSDQNRMANRFRSVEALQQFLEKGADVSQVISPEGVEQFNFFLTKDKEEKPIDQLTVDELKDFAEKNEVDITGLTKKTDILSTIEKAIDKQVE